MNINELINEYDMISSRKNLPSMTEKELLALADGIAEESHYTTVECIYNGIPCFMRITKDRGGNVDLHVDMAYEWGDINRRLVELQNEIGGLILENISLRSRLLSKD
jgi:hypothetical protein